jgi:hypothetical protein
MPQIRTAVSVAALFALAFQATAQVDPDAWRRTGGSREESLRNQQWTSQGLRPPEVVTFSSRVNSTISRVDSHSAQLRPQKTGVFAVRGDKPLPVRQVGPAITAADAEKPVIRISKPTPEPLRPVEQVRAEPRVAGAAELPRNPFAMRRGRR